MQPLSAEALSAIDHIPEQTDWEREELPLLIAAWFHLIFGHFAMAPLMREIIGKDPLSPEVLARQTRFLRKVTSRLMKPDS